jgi:PAS domain S-box-containing protein
VDKELRILLLEDVRTDAELMERELRKAKLPFSLRRVETKEAFVRELEKFRPDLILADYKLPSFDGLSALAVAQKRCPEVPFIFVSGALGEEMAIETLKKGATDYVLKSHLSGLVPAVSRALDEVEERIKRKQAEEALRKSEASLREAQRIARLGNWDWVIISNELRWSDEIYRIFGLVPQQFDATYEAFLNSVHPDDRELVKESVNKALYENKSYSIDHRIVLPDGSERIVHEQAEVFFDDTGRPIRMIGTVQDITERKKTEKELQQSFEKLEKTLRGTIGALASTVEMRDPYTAGHQQRATKLACIIAKEMGLSGEQINGLHFAGIIHDLGKIQIPAEILSKPGRISEAEFDMIKNHPQVGYDILKKMDFPWPIAHIILEHHERMNGSGYPQGLSGKDIVLEARILGVADVVEAMSSHRPYRPALGIDKALEEISKNRGTLYDPKVVDACAKLLIEKGFKFERN